MPKAAFWCKDRIFEYLGKEETKCALPVLSKQQGGFSFDGHRRSRLYRPSTLHEFGFFFVKNTPAGGSDISATQIDRKMK